MTGRSGRARPDSGQGAQDQPPAFYLPLGDGTLAATVNTQGPWSGDAAHGGPPAALLARALEALQPRPGWHVARVTVEILGPVPVEGAVGTRAEVSRPGRSVEMLEAQLVAGSRVAARARAWRIRGSAEPVPARGALEPPPRPRTEDTIDWPGGYLRALEWRFSDGSLSRPGPATVWTRTRVPLVHGEPISPLQRVMLVADVGNGISGELDLARYWFINPELTVHLHRLPDTEWVCVRARTSIDASGVGLAESVLYDERASIGRGAQSLMVGPR
ncbi:MAG: thioesterase family protein [Mycobacteriales bacterium]